MPFCRPKIGQNRNLARHFAAFSSSNQALERLAPPNALCVQHHADDDPARILEGDLHCLAWPGDRKLCRGRGIGVTARGSGRTSEVREKIRLLYEVDNWRRRLSLISTTIYLLLIYFAWKEATIPSHRAAVIQPEPLHSATRLQVSRFRQTDFLPRS
jgi:hypothetical protein